MEIIAFAITMPFSIALGAILVSQIFSAILTIVVDKWLSTSLH